MSQIRKHEIAERVDTEVEVVECLNADSATVRLPNGREVFGYLGDSAKGLVLEVGQRVKAWMFVADFSRAELRGE
jgi:hypothetical protein